MFKLFFVREPVAAIIEGLLLGTLIFVGLFWVQNLVALETLALIAYGVMAVVTIVFALRLKPPQGPWGATIGYEVFTGLIFAALLDNILLAFAVAAVEGRGFEVAQARSLLTTLLNAISLTTPVIVYFVVRLGVFAWLGLSQAPVSRSEQRSG